MSIYIKVYVRIEKDIKNTLVIFGFVLEYLERTLYKNFRENEKEYINSSRFM